jgi:hypothetical protein
MRYIFLATSPPIECAAKTNGVYPKMIREYLKDQRDELAGGPWRNLGQKYTAAISMLEKSAIFETVSFVELQFALYPKLWIRTFSKPGSTGSHICGQ